MSTTRTWLWPDRTIRKPESRVLREEHNALVNLTAALLAALENYHEWMTQARADEPEDWDTTNLVAAIDMAEAAIAVAMGDA